MTEKRRLPGSRRLAAAVLGAAAVGAGATFAATSAFDSSPRATVVVAAAAARPAAIERTTSLTPSQIYDQATPGVVDLQVTSTTQAPFGYFGQRQQQGEGSGFVYDAKGDIVTNQHVVDGANAVTVRFSDGSTAKATVVGSDPGTDVAVVHVDVAASKLHPLSLGTSTGVKPGESVVAIGSPFGLPSSITAGIVSAVGRSIDAPDGTPITGAIQTDAAINHGNSGGPLIDSGGDVIGMNAQIDSQSGGSDGVGFAIPIDTVHKIADKLIAGQTIEHAYMGVSIQTVTSTAAKALGLPVGVEVMQVTAGSPADKAGLKAGTTQKSSGGVTYTTDGDVITAMDGKAVTTAQGLQTAVAAHQPGDSVTLTVSRSGTSRSVTVTLGTRPKA